MDPGEYSKRGLSDLLSELSSRADIVNDRCATAANLSSSSPSDFPIAFPNAGIGSSSGSATVSVAARSLSDLNSRHRWAIRLLYA